jgi:Armadillo/beta-catenin-like repeat
MFLCRFICTSSGEPRIVQQPCAQIVGICLVFAAFHGSELYVQLAPAVAPLVRLLRDRASRSKCNAAGALGNLTRHADSVVPHILQAGAVQVGPFICESAMIHSRIASLVRHGTHASCCQHWVIVTMCLLRMMANTLLSLVEGGAYV